MIVKSWKFIPMSATMPCRFQLHKHRKVCCTVRQHKPQYVCVVDADERVRIRIEVFQKKTMKTTSQEQAWKHWVTVILCTISPHKEKPRNSQKLCNTRRGRKPWQRCKPWGWTSSWILAQTSPWLPQVKPRIAVTLRTTISPPRSPNHQPGTTVLLRQLGVSPLLPPPRLVQGCSADCCALTSSSPVAPDWRHHDGVDGELRTSEQREAINDNLQSAVVDLMEEEEVHTLNSNVCCDPTPCLRAHPSGCVLQWKTSAPQHSCQRTRCAMMATRIKWSTTSAGERRQGQGLPKAAEERNPELLWLKPQFHGDGHASKRKSRHGTLLGTKESLFSGSKSGPNILSQEFVLHCVRRLLLPPFLAWSHENTECEGSSGERMLTKVKNKSEVIASAQGTLLRS